MNIRSMLAGLAAIHLVASYSINSRELKIAKAIRDVEDFEIVQDKNNFHSCGGSEPSLSEAETLFRTGKNTLACDETVENDGSAHEDQIFRASMPAVVPEDLSIIAANHEVSMTFTGNENGIAPYTCMIDSTGTGAGIWTGMDVIFNSTEVISPDEVADVTLTATINPNEKCTGRLNDKENLCMVKCNDATIPRPLEKSVIVQVLDNENTPTLTYPNIKIEMRQNSNGRSSGGHPGVVQGSAGQGRNDGSGSPSGSTGQGPNNGSGSKSGSTARKGAAAAAGAAGKLAPKIGGKLPFGK